MLIDYQFTVTKILNQKGNKSPKMSIKLFFFYVSRAVLKPLSYSAKGKALVASLPLAAVEWSLAMCLEYELFC